MSKEIVKTFAAESGVALVEIKNTKRGTFTTDADYVWTTYEIQIDGETRVGGGLAALWSEYDRQVIFARCRAEDLLITEYARYVKDVAEGDPMEFDDWLAGSDLPEIVTARKSLK